MKYTIALLCLCLLLFGSCSSSKHTTSQSTNTSTSTGDGSSEQNAVVINETGETAGVADEYAWLRNHYPGYTFEKQSLVFSKDGHPYDVLDIKTSDGQKKEVYFDISKFFGKF